MFSRHTLLAMLFAVACLAMQADAGEITGAVVHRDGSKASGAAVSGLTSGIFGGVTKTVYADSSGRFRLTWSSDSNLAKVYVRGNTVATNVKNGAHVRLTVK